jgi:hypothetical protein
MTKEIAVMALLSELTERQLSGIPHSWTSDSRKLPEDAPPDCGAVEKQSVACLYGEIATVNAR